MPRLPYTHGDASAAELVKRILARRGGHLLHLDQQLLHSAPLAEGWNSLLGAVRSQFSLAGKIREIAICVVARLNQAPYEFVHHAPVLIREGGTQAQVDCLSSSEDGWLDSHVFSAAEQAVIRLTIEMTRNVSVTDRTFNEVMNAIGDERQVVELIATIAAYNMVSRFLVALQIEPE